MDNTKKKNMLVGHAALLSANVMWGLMAPLGKDLLNSGVIPSMSLAALRIIAAALLFWSVSLLVPSDIVKKEKIDSKDWWKIIVASLLVIGANQVLIILGLAMANPVDAAIICSSTPILCVLVTAVLLHRWVGWLKSLGVAIGFGGMLLFVLGGDTAASVNAPDPALGNILCIAAQLCGALYLVMFTDILQKYTPFTLMKWMFLISAVILAPFTLADIAAVEWSSLSGAMWAELAYIILCATFLAYFLLPFGQKYVAPTTVAMYNYLQPVVAVVFSIIAGLGTMNIVTAGATLLIIAGVYIVNKE